MDLPWSEEYMLRQSHPMYDAWCSEDDPPTTGENPDEDYLYEQYREENE